jgi:hypothetical protein
VSGRVLPDAAARQAPGLRARVPVRPLLTAAALAGVTTAVAAGWVTAVPIAVVTAAAIPIAAMNGYAKAYSP